MMSLEQTRLRHARSFALILQALLARSDLRAPELAVWIATHAPHDFGPAAATLSDRHICWRMRAYGIDAVGATARQCALNWAEFAHNVERPIARPHISSDSSTDHPDGQT